MMKRGGGCYSGKATFVVLGAWSYTCVYQYSEQLCSTCDMNSHCCALTGTLKGD